MSRAVLNDGLPYRKLQPQRPDPILLFFALFALFVDHAAAKRVVSQSWCNYLLPSIPGHPILVAR